MKLGPDDPLRRLMVDALLRSRRGYSPALAAPSRPRIFVSYHHDGDRSYYDALIDMFCDRYDVVHDNSPERSIDSDNTAYVRQRLCDRHIKGSSCTVVLVGSATWGRKYVDWEIGATLQKQHGLIGVRLPSVPVSATGAVIVPDRLHDNIQSGYALWMTWEQLAQSPAALTNYIEQANATPKRLINNIRANRYRNA